jgi:excisionase family DNA binding protein
VSRIFPNSLWTIFIHSPVPTAPSKTLSELIALRDYWTKKHQHVENTRSESTEKRRECGRWIAAIDLKIEELGSDHLGIEETEFLEVGSAAKYLGVSESKLYKMTSKRAIPHYKIGKRLQFRKADLDQFLETAGRKNSTQSDDEKAESHVANYPLKKKKTNSR